MYFALKGTERFAEDNDEIDGDGRFDEGRGSYEDD